MTPRLAPSGMRQDPFLARHAILAYLRVEGPNHVWSDLALQDVLRLYHCLLSLPRRFQNASIDRCGSSVA